MTKGAKRGNIMSENDKLKISVKNNNTSSREYIQYSNKDSEKQAIEALYDYYNTKTYMRLMQAY